MTISGDYNLYQYNPYNFGGLTAQGGAKTPIGEGYHQANAKPINQGVPNTTPQIFGIPSTSDMELAEKIAQSGINPVDNPFGVNTISENRNEYRPMGTGELSPVLEGREDEIENCPWSEYYA